MSMHNLPDFLDLVVGMSSSTNTSGLSADAIGDRNNGDANSSRSAALVPQPDDSSNERAQDDDSSSHIKVLADIQDNPSHTSHIDLTNKVTLQSIAFECLASGLCDSRVHSLLHVLDWPDDFSCFTIGGTQDIDFPTSRALIERKVRDLGGQYYLVGRANNLTLAVILTQGAVTPEVTCTAVMEAFANDQPVCLGPTRRNLSGAVHSLAATLASFEALPAIGTPSRPMRADDMLPERALIGDDDAANELYEHVYRSLLTDNDNDPTLQTVSTFLDNGGSLDVTAKELNVHPNTVRYRIKRAAESTGWDAGDPRDAFVLQTAIVIGRIRDHHRA